MGKREELIAKYNRDLGEKCGQVPDTELMRQVTIACGPSIYNVDAETVSAISFSERDTVKRNFLIKRLGLREGPELNDAINIVSEIYGVSNRRKYRPVFYYLLTKHFGKESVFLGD